MKKMTKILAIVMAMVLCVSIGVGATLAWLTAETETVVNTFSAAHLIKNNNFDIWEHEASTNADGTTTLKKAESKDKADLVKQNTYPRVLPGVELKKDPFVRIEVAEEAYVYVEVVGKLPTTMTWTVDDSNWTKLEGATGKNGGEVYYYNKIVKPADGVKDINIITGKKIDVAGTFDPASLAESKTLQFFGYAVQSENNGGSAANAWNATFGAPATQP